MPLTDNGLELLTTEQCRDLLSRSSVGQVGVTIAALPAIFPVNYAVLGEGIVSFGTVTAALADHPARHVVLLAAAPA